MTNLTEQWKAKSIDPEVGKRILMKSKDFINGYVSWTSDYKCEWNDFKIHDDLEWCYLDDLFKAYETSQAQAKEIEGLNAFNSRLVFQQHRDWQILSLIGHYQEIIEDMLESLKNSRGSDTKNYKSYVHNLSICFDEILKAYKNRDNKDLKPMQAKDKEIERLGKLASGNFRAYELRGQEIEELKQENKELRKANSYKPFFYRALEEDFKRAEERIEQLEKALRFYGNKENYSYYERVGEPWTIIEESDGGSQARQALAKAKEKGL